MPFLTRVESTPASTLLSFFTPINWGHHSLRKAC